MDGLATVGRWETYFNTAIGTCVISSMIACILFFAVQQMHDKHTAQTPGTTSGVTCTKNLGCDGTVAYQVAGKAFTNPYHTAASAGQANPTVYYDPTNPSDARTDKANPLLLFGIAAGLCLLLIFMIVYTVMVSQSKYLAAAAGTGDLIGAAAHFL